MWNDFYGTKAWKSLHLEGSKGEGSVWVKILFVSREISSNARAQWTEVIKEAPREALEPTYAISNVKDRL